MKKSLLYTVMLCASLAFAGCAGEEDDIFGSSALQRVEQTKRLYEKQLISSEGGWMLQYYPINNESDFKDKDAFKIKGYLMGVKFNKDKTVLVGMNNPFSGNVYKEDMSCWDILGDNGPVLSFNTYNECLHAFSSPEDITSSDIVGKDNVIYSEQGSGAEGDYEFIIVNMADNGEHAMLKGKKRSTYNYLTRLPAGTDLKEYFADIEAFKKAYFSASVPNPVMIVDGNNSYELRSMNTGISTLGLLGADFVTASTRCPYLITKQGGDYVLRFRDAIKYINANGDDVATNAQTFVYNQEKDEFACKENPDFRMTGFPIVSFVKQSVDSKHKFIMSPYTEMSDKMKQVVEEVRNEMKSKSFVFTNFDMTTDNGNPVWRVTYQAGTSSGVVSYKYNVGFDEGTNRIEFAYDSPLGNGQNVIDVFPSLKKLLDTVSQQFVVSGNINNFNYSSVRFTSATDADVWFVLNYN